ncbi:hypothetical protein Strain138_000032 [Pseudogemmatithrix spongiicola]|uniref:Uncharacterized protein n=1 Tax=Pseudogemmatithrix spongiicola TaxID=3062599 RepID=A0AA49Q422_9BACT|nr:hypothetical protein Strain138_000032 [Gemmatimonadaceae bacterium 'strain 138']WKW13709.1 hypothetical protein Strain318_000032 [Gemmatimonadaceae bacterium 'strain 318']
MSHARDVLAPPPHSLALRSEPPHEARERPLPLDKFSVRPGVVDDGLDLTAVPHDAGIAQEPGHITSAEPRHHHRVKVSKRGSKRRAFPEDRDPTEARLKTLKGEFFKETPIVADRNRPLGVVIAHVLSVITTPPTAH